MSGIDAQRDMGGAALLLRDRGQQFELRLGLHVDAQDAFVDRERKLVRGLADAGEHDLVRRNAGRARALELAFRDHVGAGAEPRQRLDHGLIRVRLHGVADERAHIRERLREHLIVPLDRRGGIAIERRADRLRQIDEIDRLGVQHAGPIGKVVHRRPAQSISQSREVFRFSGAAGAQPACRPRPRRRRLPAGLEVAGCRHRGRSRARPCGRNPRARAQPPARRARQIRQDRTWCTTSSALDRASAYLGDWITRDLLIERSIADRATFRNAHPRSLARALSQRPASRRTFFGEVPP